MYLLKTPINSSLDTPELDKNSKKNFYENFITKNDIKKKFNNSRENYKCLWAIAKRERATVKTLHQIQIASKIGPTG